MRRTTKHRRIADERSQLTLRGLDPRLLAEVRRLARVEGVSLNKAALRLLEKGAGLARAAVEESVIGSSLDRYIGTWSAEEERDFLERIRSCEQVDEEFWR